MLHNDKLHLFHLSHFLNIFLRWPNVNLLIVYDASSFFEKKVHSHGASSCATKRVRISSTAFATTRCYNTMRIRIGTFVVNVHASVRAIEIVSAITVAFVFRQVPSLHGRIRFSFTRRLEWTRLCRYEKQWTIITRRR